ncbi:TetR/AcrR family transcriptional regulator [Leptospira gomenensis]|uniref:TetR/AcrR family transcriptional regulator n=1 Tax=Leptospira gomenensis TaxID=2484974 RepID=A0A5F1Y6N7_9LEPT|nr:TetR/AcrR family transcriptional regulator [Leptospira gomenensis]TGK28807.1 TetR/AcrR family transcriptional regulator [Leptospira gomenensis]TGK40987.1 TetR/AcrR family transcriptional regulator [Leptospira gomenensis]TGK46161.1 TetR/AcrR family transcriptional regulator [Leptospira gomenensis]
MKEFKENIELDPNWPEGQKKIFLAAMDIFAEKGFSATTTGEIAKKAGVAEGLIFKHFKSKKDLLLSLAMPILEGFIAPITLRRLKAVFERDFSSLEEIIAAVFEERLSFIRKNKNLIRIIVQEAMVSPEIRSLLERVFKERLLPIVGERFAEFQSKGLIKNIPITSVLRLVATNLAGYILFTEILYQPKDWDAEAETKRTIEFIAKGLRPETNPVKASSKRIPKKKKPFRKIPKRKKKKN